MGGWMMGNALADSIFKGIKYGVPVLVVLLLLTGHWFLAMVIGVPYGMLWAKIAGVRRAGGGTKPATIDDALKSRDK